MAISATGTNKHIWDADGHRQPIDCVERTCNLPVHAIFTCPPSSRHCNLVHRNCGLTDHFLALYSENMFLAEGILLHSELQYQLRKRDRYSGHSLFPLSSIQDFQPIGIHSFPPILRACSQWSQCHEIHDGNGL